MKWKKKLLASIVSLTLYDAHAGVMREDVSVQDYRDFAENKGKYTPGATNVVVYKTDGTIAGTLDFPIPDFSVSDSLGIATLVGPSYITSVKHNGGYTGVDFGNNAKFKTTYKIINRNDYPDGPDNIDFHTPRLNKVVTETAPTPILDDVKNTTDKNRYTWYTRVGSGTQSQIDPVTKNPEKVSDAYNWVSGGMFTDPYWNGWGTVSWVNYGPPDSRAMPFSSGIQSGDSGSPVFVYDNQEKIWKLLGVTPWSGGSTPYNITSYNLVFQHDFYQSILEKNTDADVTDVIGDGDITWSANAISQGANSWAWHGVTSQALPSEASNAELDASKDLRFNGDGGKIVLEQSVNHGAAKLQFSEDYTVTSALGKDSTWVGGGVEVDEGKTVTWQVNGLEGDALHKIGAGTLLVNAIGVNGGSLNIGDGKVILAQLPDTLGNRQAFSSITLVSGRPTVQLDGDNQITANQIQFGFRGGTLDLNGHDIAFDEIKHNDSGATILNNSFTEASNVSLASSSDRSFIGEIGSTDHPRNMSLDVTTKENATYTLAGNVTVDTLTLYEGNLVLQGRPTPHANNAQFSDDWINSNFLTRITEVNTDSILTLGEHGMLEGEVIVSNGGQFIIEGRSSFNGSATLSENATLRVVQDSSLEHSTVGTNDVEINADIRGDGALVKEGNGTLWYTGNGDWTGGTTINGGQLILNGHLSSSLIMGDNTLLSGSGSTSDITLRDNAVISPGWQPASSSSSLKSDTFTPAILRVNGNLNTGINNQIILRTQHDNGNSRSDQLLINGSLIGNDPLWVNLITEDVSVNTNINHSGTADIQEGVSIVQVQGEANKDSVKLSGGYSAIGAWRYSLHAFAPEQNDTAEQYWDYRLQNDLLSEGESTASAENSESSALMLASNTAVKQPADDTRRAVIPQVPSYLSLPTALLNYNNTLRNTLHQQATWSEKENLGFFMEYFHQDDRYNSDLSFTQFGYDFDQKANGFLFGGRVGRWQSADESQQLSLNVAWSTAELSVTPHAEDGDSQGDYTAHTFSTLTEWHHTSGWFAEFMLDAAKYSGDISTTLRGENIAKVKAKGLTADLNVGKDLTFGKHVVTPMMGAGVQYLDIDDINDVDNTRAEYDAVIRPLYHAGLGYRYHITDALELTASSQVNWDESDDLDVAISGQNTDQRANFSAATPGSYASFNLGVNGKAADNIKLFANGGYQTRLGEAGIDGWQFNTGVNVSFR